MRNSESMPQYDIGVFDRFGTVGGDPGGKTGGWVAGGLRDVAAGGMELVVSVCLFSQLVLGRFGGRGEDLHFVTWMAWRAKPARFHTIPPSFGRREGTSRLMSL